MDTPLFIFVGAKPPVGRAGNPGGQLSASIGLHDYASSQGYSLEVVDTLQESFPPPPLSARLKRGIGRVYQLIMLLGTKQVKGVIIFSADGISFYERIFMAIISRIYGVKSIFFMLSGFFVADMERNSVVRAVAKVLLKAPNIIGMQGDSWRPFYKKLDVQSARMLTIMNWLPGDFTNEPKSIEFRPDQVFRFCFVGWLVEAKGVRELFDAIKILATQYEFEFVFIGGGTLQQELHDKIIENNLVNRVSLAGWLEPDAVQEHLRNSHVFVLPSKAEGFPIALLEAMALGLPAICTNVGAIADSLLNDINGYLLVDGSPESIAQAMQHYLIEPELVAHHSVEALKIVSKQHNRDENCKLLFSQFM